ncbi:YhdP family protein [Agitococcus lubricus]|uniref:Uncharacterized protein (TIGR02099 family) n=1 Tax=Agitococcus lubricus TaxID=1077255 RepID=A0A2T5ITP3_9GAMM|nr:YhdP family protein [Agitococcus lubricus]PTQ87238.1 uncharacterized protein (TIGR02099 family) [Agitococcus lubricus]
MTLYWCKVASWRTWRKVGIGLALGCCLLLCVVALLATFVLPMASHYQSRIEQQLSVAMQTPVKVTSLEAYWLGIEPDITIKGLKIYHPQHANVVLLEIPYIHLELALWQSLWHWDIRLDAQAKGISLQLAQQATGEWVIKELLALGPSRPEVRKTAVNWLLKQADLRFDELKIHLQPYQAPSIQLDDLRLINRNRGQQHDFRLYANWQQQPLKLFANLTAKADFLQASAWSGQLYTQLPTQAWQPWLHRSLTPNLGLENLLAGAEVWASLRQGQLTGLNAKLNIAHVRANYQQQNIEAQITTLFSWQQQAQGWQLDVDHVTGNINHHPVQLPNFRLLQSAAHYYRLDTSRFDIKDIVTIGHVVAPTVFRDWLRQAQPQGTIDHLALAWQTTEAAPTLLLAQVQAKAVTVKATASSIGVQNADFWLTHQPTGGVGALTIKRGVLDLKQAYRVPTPVNQLHAKLRWSADEHAWYVETNKITVANADAHGEALLKLRIPKQDPSATEMRLLASIDEGNLASVWRYVPWPPAGDDTLAWLKSALVAGRIKHGDFLYDGVLIDTPQRAPSTMQMNFWIEDGQLAYQAGWPMLKQLDAKVSIYNRRLEVMASQGQIYQSIPRHIHAVIPDLSQPVLNLTADIDATGDDMMRLFQETPLQSDTGRVAQLLHINGEIAGQLALRIPLTTANQDDVYVKVKADLTGNPVILKQSSEFDLWLTGTVNYETGRGLTSQTIQGYFLSQPVSVKLASLLDNQDVAAIQIQANGQIAPNNLKPWLGDLTRSMKGKTQYQAALTVPVSDEPVHISLSSDLQGWTIDLPEPLGKKQSAIPFHYEMQLDNQQEQSAYLMYGTRLQTGFAIKDGKITRALVQLGESWLGDLPPEGLWVKGRLGSVDIGEWLPWLRPAANNIAPKNVATVLPELQSFAVDIDRLSYGNYLLRDVRLGLEQESNQQWRLQILSNDLSGEALLPHTAQQPLVLRIQNLSLPFENTGQVQSMMQLKGQDSWSIPKIELYLADVNFKSWPKLAHSEIRATVLPTSKGIRLTQASLKNALFTIDSTLDWQWRGTESTSYSGQLVLNNAANLFTAFNRDPLLSSQQANAHLSLQWAGSPTALDLAHLNGQLSVSLDKGRVLNLNRLVSLSRLLGVLDTDNFKRRLKFDFSDITQKGLAYDKLTFKAHISEGVLKNQLAFISPSLKAQGQGEVNLVTQSLDQQVDISVPISSAVPYAAAVVAGPVVGGALVAAEALLDDPLTKATTLHYQLQGNWQNPTIHRLKKPILPWRNWFKWDKP